MSIEIALKTPGHMAPSELEVLAALANQAKRILEIGSYLGKSTRAIADNTSGFVVAADDFNGPRDHLIAWKEKQKIYDRFIGNMGEHIESRKVIPWRIDHNQMTPEKLFELVGSDEKFDMCFIDGAHHYAAVIHDIDFALQILTPDGCLCGHDFQIGAPDVMRAVNERFPNVNLFNNTSIWCRQRDSDREHFGQVAAPEHPSLQPVIT